MTMHEALRALRLAPSGGGTFVPLRDEELDAIEAALGRSLAPEYREFLATYGSCDFDSWVVFPGPEGLLPLGIFFGRTLLAETRDANERLPNGVVPINDDSGGNLFCLALSEPQRGRVYYHHHGVGIGDAHDTDEARWATLVPLAGSFSEFVRKLETDQ